MGVGGGSGATNARRPFESSHQISPEVYRSILPVFPQPMLPSVAQNRKRGDEVVARKSQDLDHDSEREEGPLTTGSELLKSKISVRSDHGPRIRGSTSLDN